MTSTGELDFNAPTFLRYYLDEHLPPAIAEHLRHRGIDAVAALEVGRAGKGI